MYSDDDLDDEPLSGFEAPDATEAPTQAEEYKYEVLNSNQIVESMVESLRDVNSVIQLSPTITRILLNHFKWDKERLYEKFFDGNKELLFVEAKIVDSASKAFKLQYKSSIQPQQYQNINHNNTAQKQPCQINSNNNKLICGTNTHNNNISQQQSLQTCPICYYDNAMFLGLGCGHSFCKECWVQYLSTKIMEEGQSGRILCPASDCNVLIDDQAVLPIVTDNRVRFRYQQLITNSYVECNKHMRWCPKPECGHAIKVAYPEMQPVRCKCDTVFCFLCGGSWHEPVKCDLIMKWKKKCDDDSETSHWIAANTKECPKCHVTIEKNGGCNHMICKKVECKEEFCWVCLGPWKLHGSSWYACNKYDETEGKAARDAQEKSRALLQRYLFYCTRYMNHMASLKFENKLYASVREKMKEMQQHNMSWIEVQFLIKAVDVLCQCRQTLMYTYVFAYYLEKTNQCVIFEDNQRDLERATELLSEYLERDVTSDNLSCIKQTVQDKYRYCESRRKILLEHVKEGYEQDWWVVTDL